MECSASRNCGLRYGRGEVRSPFCSSNGGGGEGAGLTGCERSLTCLECGVTGDKCSRSCRRGVGLPRGAKGCDSMAKSYSRSCMSTLNSLDKLSTSNVALRFDAHSRFYGRRDVAAWRELARPAQSVAPASPPQHHRHININRNLELRSCEG